jgi:hypothetical protein
MPSTRAGLLRGKTARFTLEDACGMPVAGSSTFVVNAFITAKATPNFDEGDEVKLKDANGRVAMYEPGVPSLTDMDVEIQLAKVDAGAMTMIARNLTSVLDYAGTTVGWEEGESFDVTKLVGLEIWTGTSGAVCTDGALAYGYLLYPSLVNARVTIDDVANKEITATIKAKTKANPSWGKGPYMVVAADEDNVPGRLIAVVGATAHRHFEITPIAPPAESGTAGPSMLVLPTPY